MDKYEHWLGKLFSFIFYNSKPYAVTLGQITYFSCSECRVSLAWHEHENCHKKQWEKDGTIVFLSRYLSQWFTRGGEFVSYEIEAREAENKS